VVDRLPASDANRGRLSDAVATASTRARALPSRSTTGTAVASRPTRRARTAAPPHRRSRRSCSRSTTAGRLPACNGFGAVLEYDESLIVPHPGRSLVQGALDPWTKPRYEGRRRILRETARAKGIPLDAPWSDLTGKARQFLLNGASGRFLGMLPFLQRLEAKRYKQYIRVFLRQYQLAKTCPPAAVRGSSPRPWRSAWRPDDRGGRRTHGRRHAGLDRDTRAGAVPARGGSAHPGGAHGSAFVRERRRAGYLTLDRLTRTLSGARRSAIALSNALGSHSSTRCTCWTSPPSASIPRTPAGSWLCCAGWRTAATPSSSSSTTPPPCGPPTGWWSWAPRAAKPAARW